MNNSANPFMAAAPAQPNQMVIIPVIDNYHLL
jgi:hypothetical protein